MKLHGCLWSLIHIIILDRKPHNYDQSTLFFGNTAPDVQSTHTHKQPTKKIMNQVMGVSTIIISKKGRRDKGRSICSISVQQVTGCTEFQSSLVGLIKSYTVDMITVHSTTINTHTHTQYTTTSIFPSNVLSQCPVIPSSRMAYCSS